MCSATNAQRRIAHRLRRRQKIKSLGESRLVRAVMQFQQIQEIQVRQLLLSALPAAAES
jgi:hypothetical protein